MADPVRLFSRDELRQYRYKCSHKLVISLTVGAVYLALLTFYFLNKAFHNAAMQDKLRNYGFAVAGYILLIILIGMIVRRSQALNFSRFLRGCIEFDNFGYMLEYVELRMPGPFSPCFLKYPIHLMILGKVLEHSEKPENAETGRRMIAAAADRDPALEALRDAPLADVMAFHKSFLDGHPEMIRDWRNAENFHGMLVHYILPVVIIVGILSFILKGCTPPTEDKADPTDSKAKGNSQKAATQNEAADKGKDVAAQVEEDDAAESAGAPQTQQETTAAPQA